MIKFEMEQKVAYTSNDLRFTVSGCLRSFWSADSSKSSNVWRSEVPDGSLLMSLYQKVIIF
ncbi:MAG: hypothetical protein MHMPM18_002203 [Marteilia pararefringens]